MGYKYKAKGIKEANEILQKAFKEKRKFLIYYDADIDGMVAGSLVAMYFKKYNIAYSYYINENRQHGFKLAIDDKLQGYTIIAVDFVVTETDFEQLKNVGADIISIDHHAIDSTELIGYDNGINKGVMINNQYCFEPEDYKFLSGAGMVYTVFANLFPDFDTIDTRALVGWSLLSDIRPIENENAKFFLQHTFNWNTPMGERLLQMTVKEKEWGFGEPRIDREYIDYNMSPKFNSLFRLNLGYVAVGLLEDTLDTMYDLNLAVKLQKMNIHTIESNIVIKDYKALTFGVVNVDIIKVLGTYSITNFIGVAASMKLDDAQKTVVYLCEQEGKLVRGSVRGLCDSVNYLALFEKYGFKCAGHRIAFGVLSVPEDVDYEKLSQEIYELEKDELRYRNRQVVNVFNMSLQKSYRPDLIAEYNQYVRTNYKKVLKYTGNNYKCIERANSRLYIVDGVEVQSFNKALDIDDGYILPVLTKGYLNFYLIKRV